MSCRSCQSRNQKLFPSELNVHFPGQEGLDKQTVWAFPSLRVCLDCGFTELQLEPRELHLLAEEAAPAKSPRRRGQYPLG